MVLANVLEELMDTKEVIKLKEKVKIKITELEKLLGRGLYQQDALLVKKLLKFLKE